MMYCNLTTKVVVSLVVSPTFAFSLLWSCFGLTCTVQVLYFGANASNTAVVMAVKLYSCCHPQSWRALLSSRTWGQLSAEIRSSYFKSDIQKKIYIQPSRLACQKYIEKRKGAVKMCMTVLKMRITRRNICD